AGGARPLELSRPGAARADGPLAVSADRRAAVPVDAAGTRVLLVRARDRGGGAELARGAAARRAAAVARARRRARELHAAQRAEPPGGALLPAVRDGGGASVHPPAALVRRERRGARRDAAQGRVALERRARHVRALRR